MTERCYGAFGDDVRCRCPLFGYLDARGMAAVASLDTGRKTRFLREESVPAADFAALFG